MSTGTYDPFDLEKPTLKLGNHGEWTLGDITDSRQQKLVDAANAFDDAVADENTKMAELAAIVGGLCEAGCENGDGIKDLICDLADESKHGEKALGVKALAGAVSHVMEWFNSESSVGEG